MNSPIRILHLSDFHFRSGNSWDQDPVLRALSRFIGEEVRAGLIPDLVAITGDLAYAGMSGDYDMAREWLKNQLWPKLPDDFPNDRLLLVPGNHDVDRNHVSEVGRLMQEGLLTQQSQRTIAELLGAKDARDFLLKRHTAYQKFLGNWLGEASPLPWWQKVIPIRGTRLHIAGLNTSWMACGDEDRGRLLLGRYQLNETVVSPEADGADWRIGLLHHPFDYLAEFDYAESIQTLHRQCDLLLRGHRHETEVYRVVHPDPTCSCLELAAGCVYEHGRHPNAFQWVELHREPRRVRVLFRAWIKGAWTIDLNQPGCPKGEAIFDLEQWLSNPKSPSVLHNLEERGVPPTFTGRQKELEEISARLLNANFPIITITGGAGIGKTTLATKIARDLVDHASFDAIYFIELSTAKVVYDLIGHIGDALNITYQPSFSNKEVADNYRFEQTKSRLKALLKQRKTLLILDNFDELVNDPLSIEQLRSFTNSIKDLRILVTSRHYLKLPGWEYEYELCPLPPQDAVELFSELMSNNTCNDKDKHAIRQICEILGYIPLAIELVSRHSEIGLESLINLLNKEELHLSSQIVTALLVSYSKLTDDQKKLFLMLSIFRGSFNITAVHAISQQANTNLCLEELLEWKLLESSKDRYHFLSVIRQFAKSQLDKDQQYLEIKVNNFKKDMQNTI